MGVSQEREGWQGMGYLLGSPMTSKEAHSPPGSQGHSARLQSSPFHHLGVGNAPISSGCCATAYWEAPRAEHKLWRVWRNDRDGSSEKKKPSPKAGLFQNSLLPTDELYCFCVARFW